MDKFEHRRQRLLAVRDEELAGSTSALANKIGRSASYVSRMLYPEGKAGKKRIAEDMVEVIESSFGWERGWMDADGPIARARPTAPKQTTSSPTSEENTLSAAAQTVIALVRAADARGVQPILFDSLSAALRVWINELDRAELAAGD